MWGTFWSYYVYSFFNRTSSSSYIKFHQSRIEINKKCLFMTELLYFLLGMNIIICVNLV
jgi:hypothetical protein